MNANKISASYNPQLVYNRTMKLKSFGCSFFYGSDLSDQIDHDFPPYAHGDSTWPALISKHYGFDYECYAEPGVGNFKILCDIIAQSSLDDPSIFLINWTWIDRFDFVNDLEQWTTIRPSDESDKAEIYYRNFHSQIKDMITSVYNINTAIDFLNERKIPFVMSYMDYNILDLVNTDWHDPRYLSTMQNKIKKYLVNFQGKNFLDWSREQGFAISDRYHPLEDAHRAAANYMMPIVESLLQK